MEEKGKERSKTRREKKTKNERFWKKSINVDSRTDNSSANNFFRLRKPIDTREKNIGSGGRPTTFFLAIHVPQHPRADRRWRSQRKHSSAASYAARSSIRKEWDSDRETGFLRRVTKPSLRISKSLAKRQPFRSSCSDGGGGGDANGGGDGDGGAKMQPKLCKYDANPRVP
uniref:Uncharacterized protein n=1 Tax=Vespula pensylvanica TaxID=30213 RepID=A0A834MYF1_VESPE|nr:hypothetical protein H0235_018295 [Vespula pensylvanica]